ncbi:hypothetical protein CSC3H3_08475 [Thalassospira marina]|uniref:PH domain-containing protein n=1 Tax=Thalassospira marina TaxID=2048283 RepID=A0ABN5FFL6_9PROT|nr:hypothetical protein CSC3H3_08475 [Thalassospira marina]
MAIKGPSHTQTNPGGSAGAGDDNVNKTDTDLNNSPVVPDGQDSRNTDITVMSYPRRVVMPDLIRSFLGIVLCAGIAATPDIIELLRWIAAALILLFVVYLLRTLFRLRSRMHVSDYGVRQSGVFSSSAFGWSELSGFRLRYFSTRRDGKKGWFEMTLHAAGTKLVAESSLQGFGRLLELARDAASDNQIMIDDVTRTNLLRLDEADNLVRAQGGRGGAMGEGQ